MIWKFESCEMWCCIRWLVLSVVSDRSAFTLKVKHLNRSLLTSWPWRWRHYDSSKHWELTLILLTWRIWRAPNNASRWQMGFNLAFKGLITSQKTRVFSNEVLRTSNCTRKTCIRITSIRVFLVWPRSCTFTCYDLVILNEKYITHNCGC